MIKYAFMSPHTKVEVKRKMINRDRNVKMYGAIGGSVDVKKRCY